jgi:hypothetical protein
MLAKKVTSIPRRKVLSDHPVKAGTHRPLGMVRILDNHVEHRVKFEACLGSQGKLPHLVCVGPKKLVLPASHKLSSWKLFVTKIANF